mgnify:FL=1
MIDWKLKLNDRQIISISILKHNTNLLRLYTKQTNRNYLYTAISNKIPTPQYEVTLSTLIDILTITKESECTITIRR